MIVNLFAGAGGWDLAALRLGLGSPLGLEMDLDACATRAAARLSTMAIDVRSFALERLGSIAGLIASPPCPDFSSAGRRAGLKGTTGPLVWEPLRWAEALRPEWCAWEQVDAVAPIWRVCRDRLAALGYSAWTGILCAADYGTPQVRRRAILLASRVRTVSPPAPTHSPTGAPGLFGDGLARWVSMAEALGIDAGAIVRTNNFTGAKIDGASRKYERSADRPAAALTSRGDLWRLRTGSTTEMGQGHREPYERSMARPAPVVDTKAGRSKNWNLDRRRPDHVAPLLGLDQPAPTVTSEAGCQSPWQLRHPGRSHAAPLAARPLSAPAPTVAIGHNLMDWLWERPATTVAGTPRIARPGHHGDDHQWAEAVPVTLEQLALLQDFPPGFPFAGNKTARARQIGNAIPVRLAQACLGAVAL